MPCVSPIYFVESWMNDRVLNGHHRQVQQVRNITNHVTHSSSTPSCDDWGEGGGGSHPQLSLLRELLTARSWQNNPEQQLLRQQSVTDVQGAQGLLFDREAVRQLAAATTTPSRRSCTTVDLHPPPFDNQNFQLIVRILEARWQEQEQQQRSQVLQDQMISTLLQRKQQRQLERARNGIDWNNKNQLLLWLETDPHAFPNNELLGRNHNSRRGPAYVSLSCCGDSIPQSVSATGAVSLPVLPDYSTPVSSDSTAGLSAAVGLAIRPVAVAGPASAANGLTSVNQSSLVPLSSMVPVSSGCDIVPATLSSYVSLNQQQEIPPPPNQPSLPLPDAMLTGTMVIAAEPIATGPDSSAPYSPQNREDGASLSDSDCTNDTRDAVDDRTDDDRGQKKRNSFRISHRYRNTNNNKRRHDQFWSQTSPPMGSKSGRDNVDAVPVQSKKRKGEREADHNALDWTTSTSLVSRKVASQRRTKRQYTHESFAQKLHRIVSDLEDGGRANIVSFLDDGGLRVHARETFVNEIIPLYFRGCTWASFRRQLVSYGFPFQKTGPLQGAYQNPFFLRGRPELCALIERDDSYDRKNKSAKLGKDANGKDDVKKSALST